MSPKTSTNALVRVREVFISENIPMTLSLIAQKTGLKSNAISMALSHLLKQGYVTRLQIANQINGRKLVWVYQYHHERINANQ